VAWSLLTDDLLEDEPWVNQALVSFRAPHANEAAKMTAAWLAEKAPSAESEVWLVLRKPDIAAYHTFEVGEVELPDEEREQLGLVDALILSAHVNWAAQHVDHADGGSKISSHVEQLARERVLRVVTVDAVDEETAAFWAGRGYRDSLTGHAGDDESKMRRQYRLIS
jgi:hypothetical protein